MDPATILAIGSALAQAGGTIFGGGGQQAQEFQPSDVLALMRQILPDASPEELQLAMLQMGLSRLGMQAAGEPLPAGLTLEALARGELPGASQARIREQAFAPVNEGIRRALLQAGEAAAARGIGGSTIQSSYEAELMRPMLAQAAQTEAGLGQAEIERLGGLRERALANMLAMQQSPALDRLLQIRMAQAEQRQMQISRRPGQLPPTERIGHGMSTQPGWGRSPAPTRQDLQRQIRQQMTWGGWNRG